MLFCWLIRKPKSVLSLNTQYKIIIFLLRFHHLFLSLTVVCTKRIVLRRSPFQKPLVQQNYSLKQEKEYGLEKEGGQSLKIKLAGKNVLWSNKNHSFFKVIKNRSLPIFYAEITHFYVILLHGLTLKKLDCLYFIQSFSIQYWVKIENLWDNIETIWHKEEFFFLNCI